MDIEEFAETHPEQALLLQQMTDRLPDALKILVDMFSAIATFQQAEARGDLTAAQEAAERMHQCKERSDDLERDMKELAGFLTPESKQ